jgi:hypothetical protein
MCYYCRENVWSYHYSTRKYLRGRTEEEIINLILEGSPLQVKTWLMKLSQKKRKQSSMP